MFNLNHALLIFSVLVIATGQVMFKFAARSIALPASTNWMGMLAANLVPVAVIGAALGLYFVSTLTWVYALRTIPLSTAFMFNSLAFVIVPVAGFLVFNEAMPRYFPFGLLLILAGLAIVNLG